MKKLITKNFASSNRFNKCFLSICFVPGTGLDTRQTAILLLLAPACPTLAIPHPSSLPTKTQNSTYILKPASFDSMESVVDTVGNQHIFVEAMKWKGIPALSTEHTEWATFPGPLGRQDPPKQLTTSPGRGEEGIPYWKTCTQGTRGRSEQRCWSWPESPFKGVLLELLETSQENNVFSVLLGTFMFLVHPRAVFLCRDALSHWNLECDVEVRMGRRGKQ